MRNCSRGSLWSGAGFVLASLAAVAFAVSASAKELQPIGNPVKVMPEKAMQVQFNADGTVTPLSDWMYFNGNNGGGTGTAASSLNLFDSFQNDGNDCITGAAPDGGTDCGLPGGGYRWFFGVGYCNMFTVGSFSATSTTPGDRLELGWYWYCSGSGTEECFVAIFTGTPFDDTCNAAYTLGAGVVLGFGPLTCNGGGYFYTDVCLCDFGLALDMFTDTYASIGGVLAKAFDGQTLTLATCGQFMLWGADGGNGGTDLAGTHGDISYDDDNPVDGTHTPIDECYSTAFGICPDPIHFMVGVGTCFTLPPCTGTEVVKNSVCKCPEKAKIVVKGTGPVGSEVIVRLRDADGNLLAEETVIVNSRGKWKRTFTGNDGLECGGDYNIEVEFDCGEIVDVDVTCE